LALPDCDNILATQLIVQMDPLSQLKDVFLESRRSMTEILALIPPAVDTFLEDIDPDKISPRMFVARSLSYTSDWLAKTEAAEQAHERILKDVVLHMKSKSFKVSKSRSFDLFSEKSSERLLWEVKSANAKNLTAQGEQGIIQLLRYSEALTDEKWIGVRFLLLLQDVGSIGINRYISKMAQRAGIELWLYDDKIEWPNRVYNIEKASFPGL